MHSILSNVKMNEGFEHLAKIIDYRYKRIPTVVCFQQEKHTNLNKELLSFLV